MKSNSRGASATFKWPRNSTNTQPNQATLRSSPARSSGTIDSVAIVPELRAGDERKVAWFGCVLVEFRGHLKVADAPREFDFMPTLQPPQQLDRKSVV